MPYSQLLMTSIFIKLLFDLAGAGGEPYVPPVPRGCRKEAVMWAELQRLASRGIANRADESTRSAVSTLSLCNANFGRG
jgi:hypothetical protein